MCPPHTLFFFPPPSLAPADVLLNSTYDVATGTTTVYSANSTVNQQNASTDCTTAAASRRLGEALREALPAVNNARFGHVRARLLVAANTGVDVNLIIEVVGNGNTPATALVQAYTNLLVNQSTSINLAAFSQAVAAAGGSTSNLNFTVTNVAYVIASTPAATPTPAAGPSSNTSYRTNAIIGGVIGGVAGAALLAVLALFVIRKHRGNQGKAAAAAVAAPDAVTVA